MWQTENTRNDWRQASKRIEPAQSIALRDAVEWIRPVSGLMKNHAPSHVLRTQWHCAGLGSFTVAEAVPGWIAERSHRLPCFTRVLGHLKQSAKVRGLTTERQSKRRASVAESRWLGHPLSAPGRPAAGATANRHSALEQLSYCAPGSKAGSPVWRSARPSANTACRGCRA